MERQIPLLSAVPYLRAYAGQAFVVKLGGELLDERERLDSIARDVAVLHRLHIRVVVVHGGGPQLDEVTQRLGLPVERVAGRRVTTPAVLDAAKMVFRGRLSLDLVSSMQRQGERAVGLSGADGGLLRAVRRAPSEVEDDGGQRVSVDWGEVGDIVSVDVSIVKAVLDSGAIPVLSPLASDGDGRILNVNADTTAAELAAALRAAKLVLLTRAPGILADLRDPGSLLHWTDLSELAELEKAGAFSGGMRPKIAAIRRALGSGVPRVHVVDGRRDGALLEEVFTTEGCGTLVVTEADEAPAEPLGG
jgi:acetylglutamate kinase